MITNEIPMNVQKLLNEILPEEKRKALAKAGTLVQNKSKELCGVDTGTLRNSMTYVPDGDSSVMIGSIVEYAHYHHNKNPFLQRAIEENLDGIQECLSFKL